MTREALLDGQAWFRAYRITFYLALFVTGVVRLYFISGFGPELVDRVSARLLSGFSLNLWVARIGSAAFVLTLAAAAAILVGLALRAYANLPERDLRI